MNIRKIIPILVRIFIYVYAINAFSFMYADTDLWGHLKFGQDIFEDKVLASTDPYSYTAPGAQWINHEWLMELLFYSIFSIARSQGLLLFKILLGLTIIHILSRMYFKHSNNLWVYAIHFLLFTHVIATGFTMRPQLATLLGITLLMLILHNYFEGNKKIIYAAPLLIVVWVNSHGGVVAGWGILGLVTLIETIRCLIKKGNIPFHLIIASLLSCVALLINPSGYKLLQFFVETIPRERIVLEWESIPLWGTQYLYFKVLVVLFFLTFINGQPKRLWEVSIGIFAIIFAFHQQRHSSLSTIILIPYLSIQWAGFYKEKVKISGEFPQWGYLAGVLLLIGATCLQVGNHFIKFASTGFQIKVNPVTFPVYAVRFMNDNKIGGNILLPFSWGEYVIWKLPGARVSNDGRYWTVYPNKVLLQNYIFHKGDKTWEFMLDLYPHEVILTKNENRFLEQRKDWIKIYQDGTSRIFVKKTEPPGPALKKFYENKFVYQGDPPSLNFP